MSNKDIPLIRVYKPPFYRTARFWAYFILISFILTVTFYFFVEYGIIIFPNLGGERLEYTVFSFYVTFDNPDSSVFFSFLNGLLFGAYLGVIFSNRGVSQKYLRIIVAAFVIIIVLFASVNIGFGFQIFLSMFNPQIFETNTGSGILFLIGNITLFGIIFIASLLVEGESKNV